MALSMGSVHASVPARDRVEGAVGRTNAAAGRVQALQLELVMQLGDRPAVAQGQLISHPTGMARLELRGAGGLVERHLLQGKRVLAARDGELLEEHRFFLPPLFVLQSSDGEALRRALESFDVEPESVGLAQCGEQDCLVLGDPKRHIQPLPVVEPLGLAEYDEIKSGLDQERQGEYEAARVWFWGGFDRLLLPWLNEPPPAELDASALTDHRPPNPEDPLARSEWDPLEPDEFGPSAVDPKPGPSDDPAVGEVSPSAGGFGDGRSKPALVSSGQGGPIAPPPPRMASLWVSREGYEIRGIDTLSGGRVRLGPLASYNGMLLPAWILLEEPGREPVRFEVVGASVVEAPPASFTEEWLLAPTPAPPGEEIGASAPL